MRARDRIQRAAHDSRDEGNGSAHHARFGTPARAVDVTVGAMAVIVVVSGGRVSWLARGYGMSVAVMLVLTIVSLIRLRRDRQTPAPYKAPFNPQFGKRELSVGLFMEKGQRSTDHRHACG